MTAASDTSNIAGFYFIISGGIFLAFHMAVFSGLQIVGMAFFISYNPFLP
jgi:hypothetical protein